MASPVANIDDPSQLRTVPEAKVSEETFNSLHASSSTYRDLLIFEERLKLNMTRLRKRQKKYEVSCTVLFLFFATGMYAEKLGYSSKFVPQCNRVLRIFNMHFNRDNNPELTFFRRVPRKFQEGFAAYKASYFRRRMERKAAQAAAAAAGKSGIVLGGAKVSGGAAGGSPGGTVRRRRMRPANTAGAGGGTETASGSDSGTPRLRPLTTTSSLRRGSNASVSSVSTTGSTPVSSPTLGRPSLTRERSSPMSAASSPS
ncbi:hypothetical protein BGW42_005034 [Actinomortierella wolfii]|nr:hypothetical protein BGW42_005034 [Actinomortierella wolfii]